MPDSTPPPLAYQNPSNLDVPPAVAARNKFTDTVTGPNLRLKDNLISLVGSLSGASLGLGAGYILGYSSRSPQSAALIGAFLGLIAGVFGSGMFIMIYRYRRHSRGRHD